MTKDQQREAALRIYQLGWRFPERAPATKWSTRHETIVECVNAIPNPLSGNLDPTVTVTAYNRDLVRVQISCAPEKKYWFFGTAEYVETMLRLIPAEMRPHLEASK